MFFLLLLITRDTQKGFYIYLARILTIECEQHFHFRLSISIQSSKILFLLQKVLETSIVLIT